MEPADDERADENGADARFNPEDTEPPAADAATIRSRDNQRTARASIESSQVPLRAGWNVRQPASQKGGSARAESSATNSEDSKASRSRATDRQAEELDDDGPNPLPPAREPGSVGGDNSTARLEETPLRVAQSQSRRPRTRRARDEDSDDGDRSIGIMDSPQERAPRPMPPEILPGERLITPGSYGPIVVTEPPGGDDQSAQPPRRARSSAPARAIPDPGSRTEGGPSGANDGPSGDDSSEEPRRPTWRELSLNRAPVPVDESIQRASVQARPTTTE